MKKLLMAGALFITITCNAQTITTYGGDGSGGHSGDGGLATAAAINAPRDIVLDGLGNLIIAEANSYYIRKINTSKIISTIGGSGTSGYSGDGGAALLANISPNSIAMDIAGNIYFSDYNFNVRKINTSGTISTIAGSGVSGYAGDGGAATTAKLFDPRGVVVDGLGNIYIADNQNNVIRKVNTSGTITTFAGNGTAGYSGNGGAATSAQLNGPWGLAVDAAGNVYIADKDNRVIRKVNTLGIITTVAGNGTSGFGGDGGPATSAMLANPLNVKVDGSGNLYIVDQQNFRIRKVSTSGIITTVVGNGTGTYGGDGVAATATGLTYPDAVAIDGSGNIFIAVGNRNVIYKVGTSITQVSSTIVSKKQIDIYPNPNKGKFTVNLSSELDQQVNLIISDAIGRVIKEVSANTNSAIKISFDCQAGVYFISASTEKSYYTGKLLIE